MNFLRKTITWLLFLVNTTAVGIPELLDKVVAIVNNGIILKSDIDSILKIVRINIKNTGQEISNEETLRHQILERLIIDKIIIQMAEKMQIQIPDQAINLMITNVAAQNGLTVAQLQKQLSTNGINFQDYRNNVRREMMITEILNNEVRRRITILPEEVNSLANQLNLQASQDDNVNLSHILIPLPKKATNAQIQLAINTVNKIIDQLKRGADFSKLILTYSVGSNALKGDLMGWNKVQELPTIFSQEIQHAKKGDIIGPIYSNIGFHILKLNDIQHKNIPIVVTEVKARHIFIKISPITNSKEAYKKIKKIAQQIKIGQITFLEAAKKYSEDLSFSSRGNLDWTTLDNYDPALRDALMQLRKGEISQPIQSSFGWHLIGLEDKRQVDKTDINKKKQIYNLLFNRKFNEEVQIWIQELRAASYIKTFNDSD